MNVSLNSYFGPFNIDKCRAGIRLLSQTFPESGLDPDKLTLDQCLRYCGRGYGSYDVNDALEAITTWVVPLFALPANMNFAEWSRFRFPYAGKVFVVSHQLADPVDTIWSLAAKLHLGRRLRQRCDGLELESLDIGSDGRNTAKRDIANVCYCLDDWHDRLEERVDRIFHLLGGTHQREVLHQMGVTSRSLALARVRNTLRTSMAIITYVAAAFSALLRSSSTGGLSYAQPHTIALRVLCYFLILQIILSAAAEGWPQQWAPQSSMKQLGEHLHSCDEKFGWNDLGNSEILPWQGGIYSFRPSKGLFEPCWLVQQKSGRGLLPLSRKDQSSQQIILLACALLSVWVSFAIAFLMSWFTPTVGLGGRGLAELVFVLVWTANFGLNQWMTSRIEDRKRLFNLVGTKDAIIALLLLCFFFLPFLGWYNSCKSWSAYFSLGVARSYINLDLGPVEVAHTWSIYFTGIAGGAAIQGLLALIIIKLNFDACKLSRRSDKENREEFCGNDVIARLREVKVVVDDDTDPSNNDSSALLKTEEEEVMEIEVTSPTKLQGCSTTPVLQPTSIEIQHLDTSLPTAQLKTLPSDRLSNREFPE